MTRQGLQPVLLVVSIGILGSGCVSQTPRLDQQFGSAVAAARTAQTLNPAPITADNAFQADGQSSAAAVEEYYKSFQAPQQVTGSGYSIGISAGGG